MSTTNTTGGRDYVAEPFGTFADEVDEDAVLKQAADILAKRAATSLPEPDPLPSTSIKPGQSLLCHVVSDFSLDGYRKSHLRRGAEISITHEQVSGQDWSDHRAGVNTFDRLLAEGTRIAPGPWPSWMPLWTFGDDAWKEARRAAVAGAADEHEPEARQRAMQAVVAKFGGSTFSAQTAAEYYRRFYSLPEAHNHAQEQEAKR